MDEVQSAAPKSKVLNRERVRFEVAGGNYRSVIAFDFRRQVAKFIGTHAEYDLIDALTVCSTRGNGAWKSDRSAPTKIIKRHSQRSKPTGVHLRVPDKAIGLTYFSHLSRFTKRSDGLLISANALIRSTLLNYAIDELGHTQAELAELLKSRPRASEILSRRRPLTVDMIHKISEAWKIPADLLVRPYKIERAA